MKFKIKKYSLGLILLVLLILVLPALFPLTKSGFFTMHDDQQIVRLWQLDKAVTAGQFPVRWVSDLGFGYGYPLFIFYPPLVYYLGEIYHLLLPMIGYIGAMKLVFATSFIASAVTMFFWAKHYFGPKAGLIAALFYTYAPYRALDAYVRGALAEAFSFVFLPLILLCMDKIADSVMVKKKGKLEAKKINPRWVIGLGLSYAGLMVTHNLIVLPFTLLMIFYWLLKLTALRKKEFTQYTLLLIPAGILGVSLSAFFWLPSLSEMQHTLVDEILLVERYDHSLHYVYPEQLWNSLWGYGGSTEGKLDGFSLKIGKIHVMISLFVGAIAVLAYLSKLTYVKKLKKEKRQLRFLVSSFLLLLFCTWMTTAYSSIVWDNFLPIQFLQFPWRFLTFIVLFSSILVGSSIWIMEKFVSNRYLISIVMASIILLLLFPNLKLFQPQTYLEVDDSYYTSDEFTKWKISKTSFEFVPKGVETTTENELGITQLAIDQDQIATSPYTVNAESQVQVVTDDPHHKILEVEMEESGYLMFNTYNFPGWQLFIDGEIAEIDDANRLKLIGTQLDAGEYTIEALFTNTLVRNVGNTISLLGWVVLIYLLIQPTKVNQWLEKIVRYT